MDKPIVKGSYADPKTKKTETSTNAPNQTAKTAAPAQDLTKPVVKGSYADTTPALPDRQKTVAAYYGNIPVDKGATNVELATGPVTSNGKEVAEEAGRNLTKRHWYQCETQELL